MATFPWLALRLLPFIELGFVTETIDIENAADLRRKHFLYGLPALVVGIIALLLILYGTLVQPKSLPAWYESEQANVSKAFLAESAATNPNRTATGVLNVAREARIVHERLVHLHDGSDQHRWNWIQFDREVADRIAEWLQTDRGFLTSQERQDLQEYEQEVRSSSNQMLASMAANAGDFQIAAAKQYATDLLVANAFQGNDSVKTYTALLELAEKNPDDTALLEITAETYFALESQLTGDRSPGLSVPNQVFTFLEKLKSPWAVDLSIRRHLAEDFDMASGALERLDSRKTFDDYDFQNQLALLRIGCFQGQWKTVNEQLASLLRSSQRSSSERAFLRREISKQCGMLLSSNLPATRKNWCTYADIAQNLALQLDASPLVASERLFQFVTSKGADTPDCLNVSFLESKQVPLTGILKCLYWAFQSSDAELTADYLGPDPTSTGTILAQLAITRISSHNETAAPLEILLESLVEVQAENGSAWYALATAQAIQKKLEKSRESAQKAQAIIGDSANIRHLIQQIDRQLAQSEAAPK